MFKRSLDQNGAWIWGYMEIRKEERKHLPLGLAKVCQFEADCTSALLNKT
jgi:hypothetical protein